MTHNKRLSKKQIGILWMTIPFVALILVISLYAIANFVIMASIAGGATEAGGFSFFRILLGIFGFLSILGAVVGIPVGLYFFSRVEPHEVSDLGRKTVYEGLSHEQVEYIAKWSWSAFFMHWIWTLANRGVRFWTLGFFAPIIQQYMWIKVSMHGRRMTWESGKWKSFKEFRKRQMILAWVAWFMPIVLILLFTFVFAKIPKMIMQAVIPSDIVSEIEADPFEFQRKFAMDKSSLDAVNENDPLCQGLEDLDEDGLIDQYESGLNADSELQDTDGDGFTDGEELENGYDPGGPSEMTDKQKTLYPIHQSRAERCL